MKTVPTHLLTDLASVHQLHSNMEDAFNNRDFKAVESFYSIRKAFDAYFISFLNNQSIEKNVILKNTLLRSLLESYATGRKNIRVVKNDIDLSNPDKSWQSHFLYEMSLNLSSKLTNTKTDLDLNSVPKDWDRYFRLTKTNYSIGGIASDFPGWKNLGLDKLPISSLYLVDPYFLKDWERASINLREVISGLIGNKSSVNEIEIALFVKNDRNDPRFTKTKENNCRKLNEILKDLYPNKVFKSSILYIPESKMHDRYLFTNFYYISSGKGFNVYNERKKLDQQKSNNLDIQLLAEPNAIKAILKRLSEVKNWIEGSAMNLEYSGTMPTKLFSVL